MGTSLHDAVDAFYGALNRMFKGDLEGLTAIWSARDDITDMGPTGGRHTGRAAVLEQFAREAAMGFAGTLEGVERHIVETAEMGYVVCTERGADEALDGQTKPVEIRSTTIFRREDGAWRVVHHHTDRF